MSPPRLGLLEMLHPEYEGSDNSIYPQCQWSRCLERFFIKKEKEKNTKKIESCVFGSVTTHVYVLVGRRLDQTLSS